MCVSVLFMNAPSLTQVNHFALVGLVEHELETEVAALAAVGTRVEHSNLD